MPKVIGNYGVLFWVEMVVVLYMKIVPIILALIMKLGKITFVS